MGELLRRLRQNAHVAVTPLKVLAQTDPIAFCSYTLVDEQTREGVDIQPFQIDWHEGINNHDRVVIITSPDMGKSHQITIGRTVWELGRNPDTTRCMVGSKTQKVASQKFIATVMRHIASNPRVHEVFPHLMPGKPWSANEGFTVLRGGDFDPAKDPSVIPAGPDANVLGSRITWAPFDDIIDLENTRTEYQSDKLLEWILKMVETRLSFKRGSGAGVNGKAVLLCNAWEDYDAAHKLVAEHGWHLVETPIALPSTRSAKHPWGKTRWHHVWPQSRVDGWAPATAPLVIWLKPRSEDQRRFHSAWINKCKELGEGLTLVRALEEVPKGCSVVAGVDLSSGKGKKRKNTDLSVIFVVAVGPAEVFGLDTSMLGHSAKIIRPLWIESGRWTSPEIKERIKSVARRFPGVEFRVEDNATQVYVEQDLAVDEPWIKVKGTTTGKNKHHPEHGVEGIAVELSQGKWLIPCQRDASGLLECEPEVEAWIGEMLSYDPQAHTGDLLMASWFAREGARDVFQYEAGSAMSEDEERVAGVLGKLTDEQREQARKKKVERYEAERMRAQGDELWKDLEAFGLAGDDDDDGSDPDGLYDID